MNHFAWTATPAVVQINLGGPFDLVYVNPADDPTHKDHRPGSPLSFRRRGAE